MARDVAEYWSSCCGALADYIGLYQCRACGSALNLGRSKEPHLLSEPPGTVAAAPVARAVQPVLSLDGDDDG